MKLQIKNLGPIKKGEIDLTKRFYVFVGYNNSGKTYVSQLLWSLWLRDTSRLFMGSYTRKIENIEEVDKINFSKKIIISKEMVESVQKEYENYLLREFKGSLNPNINNFLSNASTFLITRYEKIIAREYYYGIRFSDRGIILRKDKNLDFIQIDEMPERIFINYANNEDVSNGFDSFLMTSRKENKITSNIIADFILKLILKDIGSEPFFLPANRLFYPTFYKYIYSASKEEKEKINEMISAGETSTDRLKSFSKTPYTKAMDALTKEIFRFNSNGKVKANNFYKDLLLEMKNLLGGEIIMKRVEGIAPAEFYFKMEDGKELDMHISSSSANQLTTFYLYLKYWAKENSNFLIIDEPEENLHPKNQIALLNILMKFANRNNNRVLITTHSSLMTDAVNNHLHLGYLKNKGVDIQNIIKEKDLEIDSEAAMEHDDIGIYFFDGKKIVNYEVGEYGAYFRDFKKEENQVRDEANILRGMISDLENQERKERFEKNKNA